MVDPQNKLKTYWFDHRTDLPQWLSIGIGQTIAEWALVEKELEGLVLVLTNGDFEQNRILLFKVNIRTRITIIKALIESHILKKKLNEPDKEKFASIATEIDKRQGDRNLFAHGLWTKRGKSWKVLQTSGSRSIPELQPLLPKLARAVLPQSVSVTHAELLSCCRTAVRTAKQIEALSRNINKKLGPMQQTWPNYTRRRPSYTRSKIKSWIIKMSRLSGKDNVRWDHPADERQAVACAFPY